MREDPEDTGMERSNEDESGGSSDSRTLGRGDDIEMQRRDSPEVQGEEEIEEDAGERTPPLAEYREGSSLIIERKRGDGEEVRKSRKTQLTFRSRSR